MANSPWQICMYLYKFSPPSGLFLAYDFPRRNRCLKWAWLGNQVIIIQSSLSIFDTYIAKHFDYWLFFLQHCCLTSFFFIILTSYITKLCIICFYFDWYLNSLFNNILILCCYFQAHMKFPSDYPYSPPSIRFLTKVWHPNVYEVSDATSTFD